MKHISRLFSCSRCLRQTAICSHCDRGQVYCNAECSRAAREQSLKAAGKRYQQTRRGKLNHALRQRHYQERKRLKMTHHTSQVTAQSVLLHSVKKRAIKVLVKQFYGVERCCCCNKTVSSFFRLGFIRHSPTKRRLLPYSRPP